jgi:hypothetical protein
MGYAGGQHGTTTASQKEWLHSLSVLWQSSSTQKPERNREICWNFLKKDHLCLFNHNALIKHFS